MPVPAATSPPNNPQRFDIVVVGAGPAGLAAAARARECAMSVVVLERSAHLADTVFCYQKGKHVMAEPSLVPLRPSLPFSSGSREVVLDRWQRFARDAGLDVRHHQEVRAIDRLADGFVVHAADGNHYPARRVILSTSPGARWCPPTRSSCSPRCLSAAGRWPTASVSCNG